MNGRLYDPLTGRFLSPDNYIQNPGFTQNFNRYSYCYNNPLKYSDPSGDWIEYVIAAGFFI
jgi:RHS repeat-associated protein